MTGNYAVMIHFKISITTVNEPGRLVTRAEERKLRNFEKSDLLVTNKNNSYGCNCSVFYITTSTVLSDVSSMEKSLK